MSEKIKRISVKDFRAMGGLQEINRCFLHPRGLALEIIIDDNGNEKFGEVWDYRDDPEGLFFQKGVIKKDLLNAFKELYEDKKTCRKAILNGKTIQVI